VKIRLTRRATQALAAYLARVDAEDPTAALAERTRMVNALHMLATNPGLGRSRRVRGYQRPQRFWPVTGSPLVIFYEARGGTLWVRAIRHGAQRPLAR
jgi:plasmid stabilization system protein ParE